jgi:hypothetical protein
MHHNWIVTKVVTIADAVKSFNSYAVNYYCNLGVGKKQHSLFRIRRTWRIDRDQENNNQKGGQDQQVAIFYLKLVYRPVLVLP